MGRHPKGTFGTAKELFLSVVIRAGQNGITIKDTIEKSGLHRDTVYQQAKKAKKAGDIRTSRVGRYKKYFATEKAVYAADHYPALFSFHVVNYYFPSSPIEVPFQSVKLRPLNLSLEPTEEDEIKGRLREFSEKIGALVLYSVMKTLKEFEASKDKRRLSENERQNHIERLYNKFLFGIFPKEILSRFAALFSEYEETSNMEIVKSTQRHLGGTITKLDFSLKDKNKSIYELD